MSKTKVQDQKPQIDNLIESLISIKDAAARIPANGTGEGISENRLYFYCREGRIGRKWRGRWMITSAELEWFLQHGRKAVGRPSWKPTEEARQAVSAALLESDWSRTDKRRRVLLLRYGLLRGRNPMTLNAIGKTIGVTRERVRQIETEALELLGLSYLSKEE